MEIQPACADLPCHHHDDLIMMTRCVLFDDNDVWYNRSITIWRLDNNAPVSRTSHRSNHHRHPLHLFNKDTKIMPLFMKWIFIKLWFRRSSNKKKLPSYLPEHSVKHLQQEDWTSNYFDTLCPHLSIDHSRAMSEFDGLLQAICFWKTWNKKIQYWIISRILFTSINKCYTCHASVDKNVMNCLKRSGFCDSSPLW